MPQDDDVLQALRLASPSEAYRETPKLEYQGLPPLPAQAPRHEIGPETWRAPNPAADEDAVRRASSLARQAYDRGDYGDAAWNAFQSFGPMAQGIWLGPVGIKRMEKARLRHKDDWGGTNRLQEALGEPTFYGSSNDPDAMARNWREYGWTHPDTWGPNPDPLKMPATWVGTPDFGINENKLRGMATSRGGQGYTIQRGNGPLDEMTRGLENAFVAEPHLAKVPTRLEIDPSLVPGTGGGKTGTVPIVAGIPKTEHARSTNAYLQWGMEPKGWLTNEIEAQGVDRQELSDILRHELGHAFAIPQGIAVGRPAQSQRNERPVTGTDAEMQIRAMAMQAYRQFQDVRANHPNIDPAPFERHWKYMEQLLRGIPGMAGYLGLPTERNTREGLLRWGDSPSFTKQRAPGSIDTFTPDAWGTSSTGIYVGNDARNPEAILPFSSFRHPRDNPPEHPKLPDVSGQPNEIIRAILDRRNRGPGMQ